MNGSILAHDQAAVGLITKQPLREAEDDQGVQSAADDGESQGDHDRGTKFSE